MGQRGRCSTPKVMHPFPKSSLSRELKKRTETKNQFSAKQVLDALWYRQKEHLFSACLQLNN